jgi:hypothetical protein
MDFIYTPVYFTLFLNQLSFSLIIGTMSRKIACLFYKI